MFVFSLNFKLCEVIYKKYFYYNYVMYYVLCDFICKEWVLKLLNVIEWNRLWNRLFKRK